MRGDPRPLERSLHIPRGGGRHRRHGRELSLGALALNDIWFGGQTNNPWLLEEGSSGSSAGPGAATAAGCVSFAMASETGGSIIGPAMRNGVTGLRPTYGRVPRTGAIITRSQAALSPGAIAFMSACSVAWNQRTVSGEGAVALAATSAASSKSTFIHHPPSINSRLRASASYPALSGHQKKIGGDAPYVSFFVDPSNARTAERA